MKRTEFESKSFNEVMEQLEEEFDDVTTIDILKDFVKNCVDKDDFAMVLHICNAIFNDTNPSESDWYLYDYTMGTYDEPVSVSCKEDVEHLIDED